MSLAAHVGVAPDALWHHADNAELRRRRDDPNMLVPGDVIYLPSPEPSHLTVNPNGEHRFRANLLPASLRLRLMAPDAQGAAAPLANAAFRFEAAGRTSDGTSNGDGWLDVSAPATCHDGLLVIEPGTETERRIHVRIGHLDPIGEESGVRQRLANLGFPAGADLAQAVRAFQQAEGIEPSGELDDETRNRLGAAHDR